MAATPPSRLLARTPPTPLHGAKYDTGQPYQTRRSTRQSTQRAAQTPPPPSLKPLSPEQSSSKSRKFSSARSAAYTFSPPSSTQTSPRKKLFSTSKSHKRTVSGNMEESSIKPGRVESRAGGSVIAPNMLPTPAKTPRKKQVQPSKAVSRVLFPVRPDSIEDAMPTPRRNKRSKRNAGFTLDSSMDDDTTSEGGIKIYTDSKDRVPELDQSEENPFIDHPLKRDPPGPSRKAKASRKRKPQPETISKGEIQEAFNHEEGMVYVFRGRKVYKRFSSDSSPPSNSITTAQTSFEDPGISSPHFTRSSIKPRLLFPTAEQQRERQLADEEATTDIEQANDSDMTDSATEVELETQDAPVSTPVKTTVTADTPPATGHATRSATKKAELGGPSLQPDVEGEVQVRKKRRSPFDGWARRKPGASNNSATAGKGTKRHGVAMEKGDDSDGGVAVGSNGHKRVRSSVAGA